MTNQGSGGAALASGSLTGLLMAWLPGQRWFAGGARITDVDLVSDVQLASGNPEFRHLMVRAWREDGGIYQVPVGLRADLPPELDSALIGQVANGRFAYDAMHDPELASLLLIGIAGGRRTGPIQFMAAPGAVIDDRLPGRYLSADQSNTSVVFGDQAILKVLRRPHAGRHPDLEIPAALTGRGSRIVPALLGWIEQTGGSEPTALVIFHSTFPVPAQAGISPRRTLLRARLVSLHRLGRSARQLP